MTPLIRNRIAYFVIAHTSPKYPIPEYYNLVKTGEFTERHKGPVFCVSKLLNHKVLLNPKGTYLADYAVPVINSLLREIGSGVEYVSIALHRKVVVRTGFGVPAKNYPGMYIATGDSLSMDALEFDKRSQFLVMHPLNFDGGIERQYGRAHSLRDFHLLTDMAISAEVLSAGDINAFRFGTILFPGLTLGVLPYTYFRTIADLHDRFIRHTDSLDYERLMATGPGVNRARSFFCERLTSYWFKKILFCSGSQPEAQAISRVATDKENFGACINFDELNVTTGRYQAGDS